MTYASPFILSNWKPGYKLDCGNKQTQIVRQLEFGVQGGFEPRQSYPSAIVILLYFISLMKGRSKTHTIPYLSNELLPIKSLSLFILKIW